MVSEQTAAHPIAKGSFYQGITAWEKRAIPRYERLAEALRPYDCRFFVQLFTPGVHDKGTTVMDEWHPLWAASRVPSNVHHEIPMVMEQEHLDSLVRGFGRSALNLAYAGIDGVEVHAAHSYGIGQFLSPYYNKRDDGYGVGSGGATRLPLEIGEEIRRRVGSDLVVGIRLGWHDFLGDAGITPELAAAQLDILAGSELFDYFSITGGAYPTLHLGTASMRVPQGYMIPFGKAAKEVVGDRGVVMIVGRIKDLRMAERVLADGAADMIAMSRAHLADPFLVRKAKEGREHEVIRCVGINECIGRLFEHREVICAMNPASGRERRWGEGTLVPVDPTLARRVVVVGGGLAGMKTAAVAAARGHTVVLLEKEAELGGRLRTLKRLPYRGEWEDAIDNLRRAMANAGVDVRLETEATRAVLEAAHPDVVVWATGAIWDRSGFSPHDPSRAGLPGAGQDSVVDLGTAVARAIDDPASLGRKVVIAEETGSYWPLGLAELLAEHGAEVEVVSPHLFIGEETQRTLEMQHIIPALRELGVRLAAQESVTAIDGRAVTVTDVWSGETRVVAEVDTLVLSLMRVPDDGGLAEIRAAFPDVRAVGDVVAPRRTSELIYEGERVGREL
jgi:2,4-dienoyl-CoA reductase-like NADH-dependent reductase (Old Yellow Enzyme family)